MFNRSLMAALGLSILLISTEALAQVSATLVLRSGERVNGQLVDHSGVGFTMIVNGQERRFRENQVAVVDFVGGGMGIPDTEIAGIRDGEHLMILRGGESVHGMLYDMGEKNPLRVTFKTAKGERTVHSNQVGRIFLARPPAATASNPPAAPAPAPAPAPRLPADAVPQATITVAANTEWTNTGISVRKDEDLFFNPNGTIQLSGNGSDTASAAGSSRTAPGSPVPQASAGALIGRVGNSAPFLIGNQTRVNMPASGELQLGVNDDHVADNNGQMTVAILRPAGAVATSGTAVPAPAPGNRPAGAITVSGNQAWTPTGVFVRGGQTIQLSSSGRVQLSADANDVSGPIGSSRNAAAGAPMGNVPAGTLIGRIGNSAPFGIGNLTSVQMPASGPLFLGVNDDHVNDNSGEYYVVISR
jgi:hypothetical protein